MRSLLLRNAPRGTSGEQIYDVLRVLRNVVDYPLDSQSSGTVNNPAFEAQIPKFPIHKNLQDILPAFEAQIPKFPIQKNLQDILETYSSSISHWLYSRFWLCWILGIAVYRNCCRLQTAGLANDFLSVLVLANSWPQDEPCVVNLRRIQIAEIEAFFNTLTNWIDDIFDRGSHSPSGQHDIQLVVDCFHDVQARCGTILADIGATEIWNSTSLLAEISLPSLNSQTHRTAAYGACQ